MSPPNITKRYDLDNARVYLYGETPPAHASPHIEHSAGAFGGTYASITLTFIDTVNGTEEAPAKEKTYEVIPAASQYIPKPKGSALVSDTSLRLKLIDKAKLLELSFTGECQFSSDL